MGTYNGILLEIQRFYPFCMIHVEVHLLVFLSCVNYPLFLIREELYNIDMHSMEQMIRVIYSNSLIPIYVDSPTTIAIVRVSRHDESYHECTRQTDDEWA